jgi:hypothetical protein
VSYVGKFHLLLACVLTSLFLTGQAKPAPNLPPGLEFPASLRSKIVAGSTAVGTQVHAKLTMATLVDGVVIPQDAVLTGRIEQSVAKTAESPSLLKIKFESAHWKKEKVDLNLYLAGCYYPIEFNNPSEASGVHGEFGASVGGVPPNSLPRSASGISGTGMPSLDASRQNDPYPDQRPGIVFSEVSKHWVRLEKVETIAENDGSLKLTSSDRNLKLDKGTVYLLRSIAPNK